MIEPSIWFADPLKPRATRAHAAPTHLMRFLDSRTIRRTTVEYKETLQRLRLLPDAPILQKMLILAAALAVLIGFALQAPSRRLCAAATTSFSDPARAFFAASPSNTTTLCAPPWRCPAHDSGLYFSHSRTALDDPGRRRYRRSGTADGGVRHQRTPRAPHLQFDDRRPEPYELWRWPRLSQFTAPAAVRAAAQAAAAVADVAAEAAAEVEA